MAKKLTEYKFRAGRGAHNYPWEEWTDGNTYEAVEGEDFTCAALSFQNSLYAKARQVDGRRVRVNVKKDDDGKATVYFQFYTPSTNGSSPKAAAPSRKRAPRRTKVAAGK